jgi:hypothetical protein
MQSLHDRFWAGATHACSMPLAGVACVALALLLSSCSSIRPAQRATPPQDEAGPPPLYSIVCIIHGDGAYLYHDTSGDAHRADEVALARARTVAERNPQAEVFIFHERRRRHFLLFFPVRDGTFYYYRRGRLLAEESYWRDQGQSRFGLALELYNRFRAEESPELVRLFLYFGHAIPEFGGAGYDASYKDRTFTVDDLAGALKCITRDSTKVDLVVLSTCFSGTPRTIGALAPYARYIIASPDNLHLSYFDLSPLERLDIGLQGGDVSAFANTFAQHAFDRLAEDTQTAVSVVVYDVDRVRGFLDSVDGLYADALTALEGRPPASLERCDCAEDAAYALPGMSEGIAVLYRPPRFGPLKHKESHSGWECWRRQR